MTIAAQFVAADEYNALKREHAKLKAEHIALYRATADTQRKSYEEGREAARREYMRQGSRVEQTDALAHLLLPDNGGAIQFHVIGPTLPRPLTGGLLTPDPDLSLRIWGPPDEDGSYGIHEQGGGNITDFSMMFNLTADGIVIHRMETVGVRSRWDRTGASREQAL